MTEENSLRRFGRVKRKNNDEIVKKIDKIRIAEKSRKG